MKISWQLRVETIDHLALISACSVSARECPNEQDSPAEQHAGNKRYSQSGSCRRLTAGSSAGACRPRGRRQGRASQQAKQKEFAHGSQQRRVSSAQREEQHGCEKEPVEKQAEGTGYAAESESAQGGERTVGSQNQTADQGAQRTERSVSGARAQPRRQHAAR